MIVYLFTFFISTLLIYLSEKTAYKYRKILLISALLLPCLIAGARSTEIGTDINVYVKPLFDLSKDSSSFIDFLQGKWWLSWRYMYVKDFEIGFLILVYVIAKLTSNLSIVLFAIQLLIILPIYLSIKKINDKYPTWFCMLVFYMMFYNTSLNMMRQWIAMAIMLYGLHYLFNNNIKKYIFSVLIAILFHNTAIMGFAILFIYKFSIYQKLRFKIKGYSITKIYKPILIFLVGCIAILSLDIIARLMDVVGLDKYMNYIVGDNGVHVLPRQILIRLPIISILFLKWNSLTKDNKNISFYSCMLILDLLASQLISIHDYAFRIGSYFSQYNIIAYASIVYEGKTKYKKLLIVCIIVYLILYWLYYYVVKGSSMTYPYRFWFQ